MEKILTLEGQLREAKGSKLAAKVRDAGRVPAIIYGHKKEPQVISLDRHSLLEGIRHGARVIEVQTGGKKETVIIKAVQYDYLGKDIVHLDLMRVNVSEMIRVTVPVVAKGTAKGAQEGGVIEIHLNKLEVECRVTDIPESITVSIKEVNVGDTMHASDIALPEGVKLITNPELVLLTCRVVAEVKTTEELEAAAPVAPEVITEAKEKEEEAETEEKGKEKEK